MQPILLTINILTFSFALWLGLYLLARNPAKALLRYAGLGILAYALSLAAEILSDNAPSITITALLLLMQQFLVLLPAVFWTGALLQLLPETAPLRAPLIYWWSRGLLPAAMLGCLFAAGIMLVFDQSSGASLIYPVLALLAFLPLLLTDITRSFVAALLAALLFGLQVLLAILAGGATFAMLALLLATIAAAITLTIFADPLQSVIDQLVFARSPWLRRARDDARAAA